MRDLLLTLGHNASAVLVEDGCVLNAYESERLTGVKSDSNFPIAAIQAIVDRSGCAPGGKMFDRVYVCHWDPSNVLDGMKSKYWDRSVFSDKTPIIAQEHLGLTHHDAHAYAALEFAGDDFPKRDTGILVIDGFGNMSEHISFYRLNQGGVPTLARRIFGYETSLGLMYQYTTAFLGMKMHEDEYKLLGYGVHAVHILPQKPMDEAAFKMARSLLDKMRKVPRGSFDLSTLPQVQQLWAVRLTGVLDDLGMNGVDPSSHEARCVLGYVVQRTLEICVANLIQSFGVTENLIMTGGVAYNVALNRMLLKRTPGKVCFMPLAGDQGNAIGLWAFHNRHKTFEFGDLCWGVRDFAGPPESFQEQQMPEGMLLFTGEQEMEADHLIRESLENEGFVNIVRDRMEFGPRALCNTTTLAKATDPNVVDEINRINGRNTVMPFAPVVWHEHAEKVFPELGKMHKSEQFMICATDYAPKYASVFTGASLTNGQNAVTGRPQVYRPKHDNDVVAAVLKDYGLLINTSFNVHGVPICCDLKHVIHSHQYQRERNPNVRTIVVQERAS